MSPIFAVLLKIHGYMTLTIFVKTKGDWALHIIWCCWPFVPNLEKKPIRTLCAAARHVWYHNINRCRRCFWRQLILHNYSKMILILDISSNVWAWGEFFTLCLAWIREFIHTCNGNTIPSHWPHGTLKCYIWINTRVGVRAQGITINNHSIS